MTAPKPPYAMRPMRPTDAPFIFSTWMRWARQSAKWLRLLPSRIFWDDRGGYRAHVEWVLGRSKVLIACDTESPELIIGYVVVGPSGAVHMVYVDSTFRRHGVALDLLRSAVTGFGERETVCATNRPAWDAVSTRWKLKFDPLAEGLAGEAFKKWVTHWRESCVQPSEAR